MIELMYRYAVDLDGTLCTGEFWGEGEPTPKKERIEKINNLYKKGAIILIYTARAPEYYQQTLAWLIKYGVMNHGINMRIKPGADIYIDDKAINDKDFFKKTSFEKLTESLIKTARKMGSIGIKTNQPAPRPIPILKEDK